MHKPDVLIPNNLHLVDETEAAEILPKRLLCEALVEVTKVNVPACIALLDSESNRTWDG